MAKNQGLYSSKNQAKTSIEGGCHCAAVRFKATVTNNPAILICNCSVCTMTGFQHLIVPHAQFSLKSGKEILSSYQFNTKQANHLFCSQCGVKSFYQPRSHPNSWSINANCIDNFKPDQWTFKSFDGKNWSQAKNTL